MPDKYKLNDTGSYHRDSLNTLGWELTVSNALEHEQSPCRGIISKNSTFGNLLYDHLSKVVPFETVSSILEIGGGYGFVMRDFLAKKSWTQAAMLDLSPVLLDKQREILENYNVEFLLQDFFTTDIVFLNKFDLVLINEVAGDFPTLCCVDPRHLRAANPRTDPLLVKAKNMFAKYNLPVPTETFNFNLGAAEAVEKLCTASVELVFLSEHSSEAIVPEELKNIVHISSPGNPERIRLAGHDEYTVRFSHLAAIAEKLGYRVLRGQYKDFIDFEFTDRLNFIFTSHSNRDEHEIIRQFIEDLFKYEYLALIKN